MPEPLTPQERLGLVERQVIALENIAERLIDILLVLKERMPRS